MNSLERIKKEIESNSRLLVMSTSLASGFYGRIEQDWTGKILVSDEEIKLFGEYCQRVVLPDLMGNVENNRLRIAMCLAFIDSNTLDDKIKAKLGIEEEIILEKEYQVPILFRNKGTKWGRQCNDVDHHLQLLDSVMVVGVKNSDQNYKKPINFFEFCGCMVGKRYDLVSGLCFRTVEYPQSGAVFVEGVNYILRGSPSLLKEFYSVGDGDPIKGVLVEDGMADMSLMGGVWQPTRSLNQGIRC